MVTSFFWMKWTKSILIRQQNFTCPLNVSPGSLSANGGEVITANGYTRFIGTANTNMSGGARRFVSSQRQDAAFIKRFLIVEMEKPDKVAFNQCAY